ncbi:hypothetical protein Cni_G23236 [Canna indica]|uniref:CCHC-type domain-containing protein n=1 Tax=Canna indica TaxID=4628 RepID=A0AAQ3KY64_9LILI|nr:hypothetical protein Cni_G23236 [Canna indica]
MKAGPSSWVGLFRMKVNAEEWRTSPKLLEKIDKIQDSAKGSVFISEKDLEEAKMDSAVVGRPIKIDDYTLSRERGKFGRVCILMDVRKPVEQELWIETKMGKFFQSVAYENLSNICFSCGKIGHNEEKCNNKKEEKVDLGNDSRESRAENADEKLLGPWIQVQKRNRRNASVQNKVEGGLRNSFVVLNNPAFERNDKDDVAGESQKVSECRNGNRMETDLIDIV